MWVLERILNMNKQPYKDKSVNEWKDITQSLIDEHPLNIEHLVKITLSSWQDILNSKIGDYKIGKEIFPTPQIMGIFLHELIALKLEKAFPHICRREQDSGDKDVVCINDEGYSIEIKTSSNPNRIFGNRSYSQETNKSKKSKSGYYLAINFEKFKDSTNPKILKIRFGWIDHEDWLGQVASSGQQARLSADVENYKLLTIYEC